MAYNKLYLYGLMKRLEDAGIKYHWHPAQYTNVVVWYENGKNTRVEVGKKYARVYQDNGDIVYKLITKYALN